MVRGDSVQNVFFLAHAGHVMGEFTLSPLITRAHSVVSNIQTYTRTRSFSEIITLSAFCIFHSYLNVKGKICLVINIFKMNKYNILFLLCKTRFYKKQFKLYTQNTYTYLHCLYLYQCVFICTMWFLSTPQEILSTRLYMQKKTILYIWRENLG